MGKWGEKNKKRASSSMHTANEFHYGEEHVFVWLESFFSKAAVFYFLFQIWLLLYSKKENM